MGDRRVVVVPVRVLRARHTALRGWCHPCALPSLVTVELLLAIGRHHLRYATLTCCTDCGEVER